MDPLYYKAAQTRRAAAEFGPLFDAPAPPSVHAGGLPTEAIADARNAPHKARTMARVLEAIRANPDITDYELERLPEFHDIEVKNTLRCRRKDLYQAGQLVVTGRKKIDGRSFTTWGEVPSARGRAPECRNP